MSRKKSSGFNSPFAKLTLPEAPRQKAKAPPKAEPKRETSDDETFARAMSGVARLDSEEPRVEPKKRLERSGPDDEALALQELKSLVEGDAPFALTESEEQVSGAAPGVNHETVSALAKGEFAFRRHIDLHGLHRDEAKASVVAFVTTARRDGERCVLIITGRGKSSPTGVSVLKETLPRWLSRAPLSAHVLAFCTAQAVDGGPGAFYVLLRRRGVRPFGVSA